MKLLIIPSWFPNDNDPLWGNYFIKHAEALSEYADVSFMHINRVGLKELNKLGEYRRKDGFDDKRFKFKFYQTSVINLKSLNVDLAYKTYARGAYKGYKEMIRYTGKPDCILVETSLPAGLAARYIAEKENIPYIVHEHSFDVVDLPDFVKHSSQVYKDAKYAMAVNPLILERQKKFNENAIMMPNYIDTKKFDVQRQAPEVFTLLSICNFYEVKALDVLLKALAKVIFEEKITDIRLNIVGQGEYRGFYEDISHQLGLDDYVTFGGYVPNEQIPEVLARSSVLCVSSRFETFGIPIIEAFAAGLPVISTDCEGPKVLMDETRGLMVPIDDVDAYAKAIIEMKTNYDRYDPQVLKEYAFNYDKETVCRRILEVAQKAADL